MRSSADLVVLGAGPAGLAAAWRAAAAGRSTVVLERADRVGGMAASFTVGGVRVDHGSHRLHPSTDPRLLADLRRLLGDDLQLRRRNGRLLIGGRWVGFPLRPAELLRRLPPRLLAGLAVDTAGAPLRRAEPVSYADALRNGLGPALYEALYAPYARKLWGLPGSAIDVEQARRRVSADTPWKIAARMLRGERSGQGRTFWYPRRGFGQITEALAQAAVDAGAEIVTGTSAVALHPGEHRVEVDTSAGPTVTAGHVFSTVPVPALAGICRPAAPQPAVAAARRLAFRSMVLVYLVISGRPWTRFDAHYLPDPATPITRISEPANYRSSADDPADRTVLCCEIPCTEGDAIWTAGSAELTGLAGEAMARFGLPRPRIESVELRRLRTVYPVYEIGYAEHLHDLDAWARTLPRVTTFGRLGLFVHDNTHHTLRMAYDAVDALSAGGWDAAAWSAARARFAEHVVED